MAKSKKYDESSIEVAADSISGIRLKAGMYIGNLDSSGIWHLGKEGCDNCVDEFLEGRCKKILIAFNKKDGYITIADDGAGIPVKKHKTTKESTLTSILTRLHSGGKFNSNSYEHSIGTHGVGLTAITALTDHLQVFTYREKSWYTTEYKKGKETRPVTKIKSLPKILPKGVKQKSGTIIRFLPDLSIFNKGSKFSLSFAHEWAEITSYINGGINITVHDYKSTEVYHHPKGIEEYVQTLLSKNKATALGKVFTHKSPIMELAFTFSDVEGELFEGYTNSSFNSGGGGHVQAFYSALMKSLKPYMGKNTFNLPDIKEGLIGVINYKISSPTFSGQTKEKLNDIRVPKVCEAEAFTALESFFKKNAKLAKSICIRAAELRGAKDQFLTSKKLMMKLKTSKRSSILLPGKLTTAKCLASEREVFCVEGDSAAGTAKKSRFRDYQEVLALKGKILNVMRKSEAQALASEEVISILQAIGLDPSHKTPLANLRCCKLMILADSDVDGEHISALLITLIAKYLPSMFDMGMVYKVVTPVYLAKTTKNRILFGWSDRDEINKQLEKGESIRGKISFLKGLGELDPEPLRVAAFDPKTRVLKRINGLTKKTMQEFSLLMSENTDYRKALLGLN